MTIHIVKDPKAQGEAAAAIIAAQMLKKPSSVLGFATGSSPIETYAALVRLHKAGAIDFAPVRTFNLDEYVGMDPDHEQSYARFMSMHLFGHVNIKPENAVLPNGLAEDLAAECKQYERRIEAAGGIDLQLLGIGHNGHIGFNEPDDAFAGETHVVALSARTIEANKRFFASAAEVPQRALSMGIGTIMRARTVVLVAAGQDKADILHEALCGPVTPKVPASILQYHRDATIILDSAAAARL